jgi:hypothetical protein
VCYISPPRPGSGTHIILQLCQQAGTEPLQQVCEHAGVHRALAESVLGLRAPGQVVQDMARLLGPVPYQHQTAYAMTSEIYGTCRMLLAPLERDLLEQVVSGCGCDFYDILEPLRKVRPVNGGPGWSEELVHELRTLNFQLG